MLFRFPSKTLPHMTGDSGRVKGGGRRKCGEEQEERREGKMWLVCKLNKEKRERTYFMKHIENII